MKNYILFLGLAAITAFISCSKDDDTKPQTRTEMLTGKKWLLVARTQTKSDAPASPKDVYTPLDSCTKDDLEIFSPDGKYIFDEGPSKCKPTDPQVFAEGTWTFTSDESKIAFTFFGLPGESDLLELTPTKLVTRETTSKQGISTVTTSTYEGQ